MIPSLNSIGDTKISLLISLIYYFDYSPIISSFRLKSYLKSKLNVSLY